MPEEHSQLQNSVAGKPIQIMIVDDHVLVRKGMKAFLQEFEDIQVIAEAGDGWQAIELVRQKKPDVVLIDLLMPGIDGIETIRRLVAIQPELGIIVLTACPKDENFSPAIRAGAMDYLEKDARPEELLRSIRTVSTGTPALDPKIAWKLLHAMIRTETTGHGDKELSNREIEVLSLLTKGKTDHEIASQLVVSEVTIRTHIARILSKLGLKNRVQAALYAIKSELVSIGETMEET